MSKGNQRPVQSINEHSICLRVTEEFSVTVIQNPEFEFTMTTKEVALGYGVSEYTIRQHKKDHSDELYEGKHFLSNVSITHAASKGSSRGTMWTKRGIVRLGNFIKSEKAKLFRDWAEDLVIDALENKDLFGQKVTSPLSLPAKRNHNRLTQARLVSILSDVCKIEDAELRLSLIEKLGLI